KPLSATSREEPRKPEPLSTRWSVVTLNRCGQQQGARISDWNAGSSIQSNPGTTLTITARHPAICGQLKNIAKLRISLRSSLETKRDYGERSLRVSGSLE